MNLNLGDVDVERGVLSINNTKCFKSRLVPNAGSCRLSAMAAPEASGTAVSATWNGKKGDGTDAPAGVYSYDISANAQSRADGIVCIWRSTGRACALTVEGWDFPHNAAQLDEVAKQCSKRGFDVLCLPRQIAMWNNFRAAFENYPVEVLFVKSHGAYEIRNNDCQPALIPQITQFLLQDAVVCSYRPEKTGGGYFTEYPAPGDKAYADLAEHWQLHPSWAR